MRKRKKRIKKRNPRTSWWNLQGDKQIAIKGRMLKKRIWGIDGKINTMWKDIVNSIKKVTVKVLGELKGEEPFNKQIWWWNDKI